MVTERSIQDESGTLGPVVALLVAAPLIAEVLPGATRLSALFVFPIEVCVWGIGALLIREAVQKWSLGWQHMLLLALALSIAEEFVVQQTSVAPLVVKIKGETYARAFDVNYLYFLWALIYETVLVVFVPIHLISLMFPTKANQPWVGRAATVLLMLMFLLGCVAAWFTWTQIARTKVFMADPYTPPLYLVIPALLLIVGLITVAIGPWCRFLTGAVRPLAVPQPLLLGGIGALWAVLLYGVLVLAFGIMPEFPEVLAVLWGLVLAVLAVWLVPRWAANAEWKPRHQAALIFGIMSGAMVISFVGFIVSTWWDLAFKIIINLLAVGWMWWWSRRSGIFKTDK